MKPVSVAIVGVGRVGTALARRLAEAGHRIDELVCRNPASSPRARQLARQLHGKVHTIQSARLQADVVWFCVGDSDISKAASAFADRDWRGRFAFHASGIMSSEALAALVTRGASVASVHPLMTFVPGAIPKLDGAMFGIEGDRRAVALARAIVRSLGGVPVELREADKAAYHAFATTISPLLVALMSAAENIAASAGIPRHSVRPGMAPIMRATLENYFQIGAAAFTGPVARGDTSTVKRHLQALRADPEGLDCYLALAYAALTNLPSRRNKQMKAVLDEFISRETRRSAGRTSQARRRSVRQS
jgi:predicted short-subunit dehydrogenase-like oxidoreductase (DUF2520 family)